MQVEEAVSGEMVRCALAIGVVVVITIGTLGAIDEWKRRRWRRW